MDPVKSLAQMQVTREEEALKFWPRIKKFGPPLAVFGSGVSRLGQLKVLPFKGPDKLIQAPIPVCQKPCDRGDEVKGLNCGLKTNEVGPPLLIVGIGEPGHLRQIKVLPYEKPEEPSTALHPEQAAPKGEASCQRPCDGGEEEESLNCGLNTEEVRPPLAIVGFGVSGQRRQIKVLPDKQRDQPRQALPPKPAATKCKPRKIAGFDDARHQRLRPLRWKVHPAPVLVSEQAENLTQPLRLEPQKRGSPPKPEDSSPPPQPTKRLGLGYLMEKFREYKEKKDQMRKQKAEEQYERWSAFKSRFPGIFSEQQNEAYTRGFDAGRQGILKAMF